MIVQVTWWETTCLQTVAVWLRFTGKVLRTTKETDFEHILIFVDKSNSSATNLFAKSDSAELAAN